MFQKRKSRLTELLPNIKLNWKNETTYFYKVDFETFKELFENDFTREGITKSYYTK